MPFFKYKLTIYYTKSISLYLYQCFLPIIGKFRLGHFMMVIFSYFYYNPFSYKVSFGHLYYKVGSKEGLVSCYMGIY